jgi:hypothetical protein
MDDIQIPISIGELLDKISILSIKSQYTTINMSQRTPRPYINRKETSSL